MVRFLLAPSFGLVAIHATIAASFAATTYYSERSVFKNVAGRVVTEDFESARLRGLPVRNIDQVLNDQTNNGVFSPGDIQSGLTVVYPFRMAVVDADYVTGTSKMVRDQAEGELNDRRLGLWFDTPITSLGFDIFAASMPGPSQAVDGFGSIIRASPAPVERFDFSLAESTGAFVGIFSDEPFTGVSISLRSRTPAFVDNISFLAIPEPTTLTLAGLGLVAAVWWRRRR